MNKKKIVLLLLLAFVALTLSACSGRAVINNWPGLASDSERAYLSSGSFIYAVDVTSGKEIWRYPAEAEATHLFYSSAVLTEDGQLLAGSVGTSPVIVSLDPVTGAENWTKTLNGIHGTWVASPLVFNETIYAPNTNGFLYTFDLNGNETADPIELGGSLWSTPATDGEQLYITSLDHHLHVLQPATGESKQVDLGGAAPSSPVVDENGVYTGSFASQIVFISANADQQSLAQASNWIWGTPALAEQTLYYADLNGAIYALDLSNNSQKWPELKPAGPIVASPLATENQIYFVSEDGALLALDLNGEVIWEKSIEGKLYTTPTLAGETLLVAPYQAEFALAAYDIEGKQIWTFTPEK